MIPKLLSECCGFPKTVFLALLLFLALTHRLQQQIFPRNLLLFVYLIVYSRTHWQQHLERKGKKKCRVKRTKRRLPTSWWEPQSRNCLFFGPVHSELGGYRKVIVRHSGSLYGRWASDGEIPNGSPHFLTFHWGYPSLVYSLFSPRTPLQLPPRGCAKSPCTHNAQWGEMESLCFVGAEHSQWIHSLLGKRTALFRARCSHVSAYLEAFLIHLLGSLVLPREGK